MKKTGFATFATVRSMAHGSEYGSKKKMAEGGNDAELLKEKANKYFKGNLESLSGLWLLSVVCNGHGCDREPRGDAAVSRQGPNRSRELTSG